MKQLSPQERIDLHKENIELFFPDLTIVVDKSDRIIVKKSDTFIWVYEFYINLNEYAVSKEIIKALVEIEQRLKDHDR